MTPRPFRRGLVLGGGGVSGIAWEVGVLAGLVTHGVDLSEADVILGTSAGSVVGALLASGGSPAALYAENVADIPGPRPSPTEAAAAGRDIGRDEGTPAQRPAAIGTAAMIRLLATFATPVGKNRATRALGRWAHTHADNPPSDLRAVLGHRLPRHTWPEAPRLIVTATDVHTGLVHLLDKDSGADLVDAVTASCTVPGVWPTVRIGGRDFMDGGIRTPVNADLIGGCDRVVVIAPQPRALRPSSAATVQVRTLGAGVRSVVVTTDADSKRAMGRNLLDPRNGPPSARAGFAQAAEVTDQVAAVWAVR